MRHKPSFLRSIQHLPRLCEKCCVHEREGVRLEIDRRVPAAFGDGAYVRDNVHYLCVDCHIEKGRHEMRVRVAGIQPGVDLWTDYAFPVEAQWLQGYGDLFAVERYRALARFIKFRAQTFEQYQRERAELQYLALWDAIEMYEPQLMLAGLWRHNKVNSAAHVRQAGLFDA
jgi:hypothetical protein